MLYQVKSRFKLTIVVMLSLACYSPTWAQESEWQDSLEYFQETDSLNGYILFVNRKYHETKKIYKVDNPNERALQWLEGNPLFREPNTVEEKYNARKYLSLTAYIYYLVNGEDSHYLEKLLVAHEYATDKVLLDKSAWFIEFQIGHYYATKNNYDKALQYYRSILPGLKKRENYKRLSRVLSDMGNNYKWKGDNQKALEVLKEAESIALATTNGKSIRAATTKIRSYYFEVGDTLNFIKYYLKSSQIIAEVESYDRELYKSINAQEYSKYLATSGQHNRALQFLYSADSLLNLTYSNSKRREFAKNDLAIGRILFVKGEIIETLQRIEIGYQRLLPNYEIYKQSLPKKEQIYNENTLIDLLCLQSEVYKILYSNSGDTKYLDSISTSLELAILSSETLRDEMLYTNSKIKSTSAVRYLVNDAVENLFQKEMAGVFEAADISNLRELLNKSKNSLLSTQKEMNSKIQNLDFKDKLIVDSLQNNIAKNIEKRSKENANKDSLNTGILRIKEKIDSKISDQLTELDVVGSNNYIEFFEGDSSIYLISDIESNHTLKRLGSMQEFRTRVNALNANMKPESSIDSINVALEKLYDFLFPDIMMLHDNITIIVDGLTSIVPFDALRKEGKYLIHGNNITIRYHYLHRMDEEKPKYRNMYCLAPKYLNGSKVSKSRGGLYHLPFAKEEVKLIEDVMNLKSSRDSNINVNSLVDNLNVTDIFHFAGHAIADGDSAYLVLSADTILHKFTFEQILNRSMNVDLVTLSACETGLGSLQYGDGLNSICRSFLGAGAKDVIYSLWVVNDVSTSTLMSGLYTYLKKGLSPEESLRQAKLDFIEKSAPEFRHPYYWAGFVTTGTTSTLDDRRKFNFKYMLLLLIPYLLYLKLRTK